MNATKNGIADCLSCKAIDEAILESAFLDVCGLLAGNFDDVLDVVILSYAAVKIEEKSYISGVIIFKTFKFFHVLY